MTHTEIAFSIWCALIGLIVLCLIAALGKSFGYKTVLGAIAAVVVVYGGGIGLIGYTVWAIFGAH